jgi:hypothetical protein
MCFGFGYALNTPTPPDPDTVMNYPIFWAWRNATIFLKPELPEVTRAVRQDAPFKKTECQKI